MEITINGQVHPVKVDKNMPLLWYLRDELGFIGTKYGCDKGLCGACVVLVDGVARRSCVLPLAAIKSQQVTTIEGLSKDQAHPVQVAWLEQDVSQCGYCQAGQILSAVALLKATPEPTDADIDEAMQGICRCGTYQRIRAAIHQAAAKAGK